MIYIYELNFLSVLSNDEEEALVEDCTRRASELLKLPRRFIAFEAWCLLNASMNLPGRNY